MDNTEKKITRIAAVGDIHVRETDSGEWEKYFAEVSKQADVLLLCGDLTDTGRTAEAEILADELKACSIPVVAVLGNHDYERDNQKSIRKVLTKAKVHLLDGDSIVIGDVGFAGVKGFGGGFDRGMLGMFGEPMIKSFVQEAVDESLKLDSALSRLEGEYVDIKMIAVLHYSPIRATVVGEPEQIFPFLGSSRLAEPLNRRGVQAAFHGHAHIGTLEGETTKGVKVFNVSKPILQREGFEPPFYIFQV
ncbi:metallophosphoesterase family protein [Pontibacter akesuensis]|uniref:Predicted phosphoesterase n=1 Tax=Pontibacter akesuensis TaxID=388950 RepID=A0A1I7KWA9_9BACT|nr:metallophosphoesterase [Pontibacter akesuensis]GHA80500.1 metallophosphoesterase [Pontibacter akesuensis]SFV01710.1 Predicted phosphoesterase [Pontibacter akesuensis]